MYKEKKIKIDIDSPMKGLINMSYMFKKGKGHETFFQRTVQFSSIQSLSSVDSLRPMNSSTPGLPWQPTPVLLPGKSYGQRRLVGYSPWGHKKSDTTE